MNHAAAMAKVNVGCPQCSSSSQMVGTTQGPDHNRTQGATIWKLINCCCFLFMPYNYTQRLDANRDAGGEGHSYTNTHVPLGDEAVVQTWHRFRKANNNFIGVSYPTDLKCSHTAADTMCANNSRYKQRFRSLYPQHWWAALICY